MFGELGVVQELLEHKVQGREMRGMRGKLNSWLVQDLCGTSNNVLLPFTAQTNCHRTCLCCLSCATSPNSAPVPPHHADVWFCCHVTFSDSDLLPSLL